MTDWIENPYANRRKMPEEAHNYTKIDALTDWGQVWEECEPVIAFIGPAIITHWRPSASCFQEEMFT